MSDLLQLSSAACDMAVQSGADFADVVTYRGKSISVELEKNSIKSSDVKITSGLSVRAIYKGGVGWASTDSLSEADIRAAAVNAAELAKLAEPDPDFVMLPDPSDYPQVEGLFDPKVAELSVKDVIKIALHNIDSARTVAEDVNVHGRASASHSERALANSLGVRAVDQGSYIGASVFAIIRRGDDVGSFYDYDSARVMADFDSTHVGASATREALQFLQSRDVETQSLPIILGPMSGIWLLEAIVDNLNAESIQRNRSFMAGRKGQKVGSDIITLVDDPLIPRGLGSRFHDGEGFPSRRLTVVENGVVMSYLHSSYTANKAGEPNTGHSTRGGISSSNVIPSLGPKTAAEIIKETDEGIYINAGNIEPNGITGEVSSVVDFGHKIENGELAYPVKNTMVAGDFLEMLKNLDAISSDYRQEPGVIMPTVRVRDVRVAGAK